MQQKTELNLSSPTKDYSIYGGIPVKEENKSKIDYSIYGGTPVAARKAGLAESVGLGVAEGLLGIPAISEIASSKIEKEIQKKTGMDIPFKGFSPSSLKYSGLSFAKSMVEKATGLKSPKIIDDLIETYNVKNPLPNPIDYYLDQTHPELQTEENKESPYSKLLSTFPESEDQLSRRARTGVSAAILGAPFGVPGVVGGVIGSQAGQTVRELFGNEGKFDEFGLGEASAIGADLLFGGASGIIADLVRQSPRIAAKAAPNVFQQGNSRLRNSLIKNQIQGERTALEETINSFGQQEIKNFETAINKITPERITDITEASASTMQQEANNLYRNQQLNIISPINQTPEQTGRVLQEQANEVFRTEVLQAERSAYNQAQEAAQGLQGEAPRTLEQATKLREQLTVNNPTPEQESLINFLDGFIADLETKTPEKITPASSLLNAQGQPITPSSTIPASTKPTKRTVNEFIDRLQRANNAVSYDSETRLQSHRLKPILATFREEISNMLAKRPDARTAYEVANELHGRNAEVWGTRYMRNVRFGENPETIISRAKVASNMQNFNEAMQNVGSQNMLQRQVVASMTESGNASANRIALTKLAPELSQNSQAVAHNLINVKDPLTSVGGRAALRNSILTEAANAVTTGQKPTSILQLMQTPKGLRLVRESLNSTANGRRLLKTIEKQYVQDLFSTVLDKNGKIDFTKARNIIKDADTRAVLQEIGGNHLVGQFDRLERMANNLQRNIDLYKNPKVISLIQEASKKLKGSAMLGAFFHMLNVPTPIIIGLGLAKSVGELTAIAGKSAFKKLLSNPRSVQILEQISNANTAEKLMEQIPRLIGEINKKEE